jgi:hypothetical protein
MGQRMPEGDGPGAVDVNTAAFKTLLEQVGSGVLGWH